MKISILIAVAMNFVFMATANGSDWTEKAERLAKLRTEVRQLNAELEQSQASTLQRQRSLESQVSDLELQIRREAAQLSQLAEKKRALQETLDNQADKSDLKANVLAGANDLKHFISTGIPFRIDERIAAVDSVLDKLENKSLSVEQAATRLWALCEDEHRLTSENQLDRGVITLNGQEVMVEQFRMGMTGILFMAPDGRSGFASKDAGSWTWSLFQSQEEKELVSDLFLSAQRGIRSGRFNLPNIWKNQ